MTLHDAASRRFDYAFSKWLAGYFPKLSIKEHDSIVEAATGIAANVYCGMTIELVEQFMREHQHDSSEELLTTLIKMLSNVDNEWFVIYKPVEST